MTTRLIDLSAAPAAAAAVAEQDFNENLQTTALAQMLSILNSGKAFPTENHRAAIELLQLEGIAIAVEFLAQQCGIGEHEWVKLLRGQIVATNTSNMKTAKQAAEAAQEAKAAIAKAQQPAADGVTNVSIGVSPQPTAENAGAIRSALLMQFILLSQHFPDSALEPEAARVARGWLPEEAADDDGEAHRPG
jgi:hypothetical protein